MLNLFWRLPVLAGLLLSGIWTPARGAEPTVRILASFYPMYIATLNVAHDIPGVTVANLTQPQTGCLHDYQLTTEDLTKLATADIFVVNGAGMESFLEKIVQELPQLKLAQASQGIVLIKGEEGDNPHIWVSVSLYMKQIENLAAQLSQIDPTHAGQYRANADAYLAKLEKLRASMHEGLKDLRTRDIITFHEAFPYFAQEFGLRIAAVIEREPGSEPSARELAETVDLIRKTGLKALFAEPQYSAKAAETIARETSATIYTLDPGVTGPMAADAYLRLMERNLAELQKALK